MKLSTRFLLTTSICVACGFLGGYQFKSVKVEYRVATDDYNLLGYLKSQLSQAQDKALQCEITQMEAKHGVTLKDRLQAIRTASYSAE